ncbi:hypothetical protein NUU61_004815 [Penicillium alfredii]|uniref:Uncharacterized protein n=1 Tax=Penicillium alfredii TaxID=1506179 RepID=A0A9W9K715_9EURO|nr:uncharacterized protein NUU61_004815 [Penicillium alfredii]KAJ5095459.1 hypothetical protein NUU61_004815 [Penicillium alfredii]
MKFLPILTTLTTLTAASAIPPTDNALARRGDGPEDKSGNSQFVLQCEGTTVPNPGGAGGEGEGGGSYFNSNMVFNANGQKINPEACTQKDSVCDNCLFSGGGLSSPTNVTGCWNPPGGKRGCTIQFMYNGHDYDSDKGDKACGTTNQFQPFAFDLSALCYFNV